MDGIKLKKLLDDIGNVSIIVLGDFCLDAYWFVDESMSEISVETGEATRPVMRQRYSLGGAGNVASNLAAMGVRDVRAFGVIGTDPFGREMLRIMGDAGIDYRNMLIQQDNWDTHTYSKPYIGDRELNRIDFGNFNSLSDDTAEKLIAGLESLIPHAGAVIINQQVPSGIHTLYFRNRLKELIRRYPSTVFITDSRNYNDEFEGTIRKMNDTEAARLCGKLYGPDENIPLGELSVFAERLNRKYNKPLFITRGSRGSLIAGSDGVTGIPGLMILSRVDTVGAGDSYLAGAASALAAGYSMEEAASLGTFVAGVTVRKLFQTGTASPSEILEAGQDPDYIYSPELAEDARRAEYLPGTEIEIVRRWSDKPVLQHAIFDHDGTVSTLREGWEQIMAPMMLRAILGDRYNDIDRTVYEHVLRHVNEYIDKTTGIQTLAQMAGLVDLVREFGYVAQDKILDEHGYKLIYNEALLVLVNGRLEKLRKGELSVADLTLKGVTDVLEILHKSGVVLHLASGTDTADVQREAEALGYAHYFGDRIYGAVGDLKKEAKKIVLDRILDSIGPSNAGGIVTFGDGPVEIRETRKHGGLTVGVASNELRRYGLNDRKRTRLIKAGADIVIPDFSSANNVLKLLNVSL